MSDDIPNCDDCSIKSCRYNPLTDIYLELYESIDAIGIQNNIRFSGCLQNPKTIEYINKPIIEELERRREIISCRNDETPAYLTQGNVSESKMYMIDEVIQLLKEGVKKK